MQIISRKAAKSAGLKYYFTGKPCNRGGHIEKRFVSSFLCMECAREKRRETYHRLEHTERQALRVKRRPYVQQWREANRERLLAYQKVRNAAQKEQNPDYFKQHYAANKERRKQESLAWYQANAEYAAERQKAYVAKQMVERPDYIRAQKRKATNTRRAIVNSVFVEVIDPRVVCARDKWICGICLATVDPVSTWEIDHVIPISKGGPHSYANVQLSHRRCNRAKWARLPDGQIQRQRRHGLDAGDPTPYLRAQTPGRGRCVPGP